MSRTEAIKALSSTDGFFRHWMPYSQRIALTQALSGDHGFRAISPVFPDFLVLTEWCVRNGWRMVTDLDKAREYPVGFYIKEAPNED